MTFECQHVGCDRDGLWVPRLSLVGRKPGLWPRLLRRQECPGLVILPLPLCAACRDHFPVETLIKLPGTLHVLATVFATRRLVPLIEHTGLDWLPLSETHIGDILRRLVEGESGD